MSNAKILCHFYTHRGTRNTKNKNSVENKTNQTLLTVIHQTLQDVLQLIWVIITSLSWSRDSYYCNTRRNQGLFVPTVLYCPFFYSPFLISQSSYDLKAKHTAYTSEFTLVESENIKQYRTNKESKKLGSAIVLHTKHDVTQKKQQSILKNN